MPFEEYTQWNQPDIGGLSRNLVNAISGSGDVPGLATEATLLAVKADLETSYNLGTIKAINALILTFEALYSTSDGSSVANLLEEIIIQLGTIDSNTDKLALPNSAVSFDSVVVGLTAAATIANLNTWKADHPTYILLDWEIITTAEDGDAILIRYTT